jgi:hypothetical protein
LIKSDLGSGALDEKHDCMGYDSYSAFYWN